MRTGDEGTEHMKVCIVGNAINFQWADKAHKPQCKSSLIDSFDVVMRLNWCPFYLRGWTGWKTDVLTVRSASGPFGKRMCDQYDYSIPLEIVSSVRRLIVIGDTPKDDQASATEPYLKRYPFLYRAQKEFLPFETYYHQTQEEIGIPRHLIPTCGVIALRHSLERWPDSELFLAGWRYEMTEAHEVHDYEIEKSWVMGMVDTGRLTLLTP